MGIKEGIYYVIKLNPYERSKIRLINVKLHEIDPRVYHRQNFAFFSILFLD